MTFAIICLAVLVAASVAVGTLDVLDRRRHRVRPIILDPARVRAATRARQFGHVPDGYFDELCAGLRAELDCRGAFVSLITAGEQTMKGMAGLPESRRVLPIDYSICQYVVIAGHALEFPDTSVAPELGRCRALDHVGAYLGDLVMFDGQRVGAVGVLDDRPRPDFVDAVDRLRPYARAVERELERRAHPRR